MLSLWHHFSFHLLEVLSISFCLVQQPEIIELCFDKQRQGHSKVTAWSECYHFIMTLSPQKLRSFQKCYAVLMLSFKETPQQQLAPVT